MLKTYPKSSQESLSVHFNVSEFMCPCSHCLSTVLDTALIEKLEEVRRILGVPLRINSGYRCPSYQIELRLRGYETSVGPSQHELGRASDISSEPLTGVELEKAAREAGFMAVGVAHSWIHVDLRNDKTRRWEYTKR